MILCRVCSRHKEDEDFSSSYHGRATGICKSCHPDYSRAIRLGKDINEIRKKRIQQAGICSICSEKSENLHLDHCHTTGNVRGYLCRECNVGIGFFGDSPRKLRAAIYYLDHHSQKEKSKDGKDQDRMVQDDKA